MKYIEFSVKERIGFIILNRPEKRNALNFEMISELKTAFSVLEKDSQVSAIILSARGQAFCAGADLTYLQELQQFSYEENLADSNHLKELLLQIYTLKKVVIAQVQGHALAGGCGLVSVCDFAFSVPDAKFGYTEVKIGFIPAIVLVFLLRKIGEGKVKQLLLSGELVSAAEAHQLGIVNSIIQAENLSSEVTAFAHKLCLTNSAYAMMVTKQMIAQVQSMPLETALSFAAEMNAKTRESDDCRRGVGAFLRKEKLVW
ncbi:MAG: enoyl-CoA hydratase-related protein [Cyclobacteriaceae bacterium]|jgi:methylglutaconyl-CoA hydratase|nr:enoyl-CoA hydratase-related protein [Cyclobacteriaceae bacterium]MDH4298570.1 enoyl-CoA hydratase-related protein [Cyclobacteriaceae bacterium]MDH5249583.1 enoyl-CoA hydratase-related protein [Cyclobacteriaceae bacterium]